MALDHLGSIGFVELGTAAAHAMNWSQDVSPLFSRVALLGQIGYLLELAMATAATAFGAISVCRCLGMSPHLCRAATVDCNCRSLNGVYDTGHGNDDPGEVLINIRLEDGIVRFLHRQRCIVTIHQLSGGVQVTGREAWHARRVRNAASAREPKEHPAPMAGRFGTQGGASK